MVHRMTTWTLNAVLATMAATAVFLPAPDEIRKAIEYKQSPGKVQIGNRVEGVGTIEISGTGKLHTASVEIEHPVALDCLRDREVRFPSDITSCVPQIIEEVSKFDRAAIDLKAQGRRIYPDPRIEAKRLAVINMCRAKWATQGSSTPTLSMSDCSRVSVGIDY